MTRCALDQLINPASAINGLDLRGQIESDLKHWVIGGWVYADAGKPRFLKRLSAKEVWEIRMTEPRVQARLFSRFAEPDTLITTSFRTRPFLKGKKSQEWNDEIDSCVSCWNKLFPGIPPFIGVSIHEYVTEKCDDFPI